MVNNYASRIRARIPTWIRARIHVGIPARIRARIRLRIHARIPARIRARIHVDLTARIRARIPTWNTQFLCPEFARFVSLREILDIKGGGIRGDFISNSSDSWT